MEEDKKLWTPAEIEKKIIEFDEKIASVDDMNTENISIEQLMFDKGVFLKNKALQHDEALVVFRELLTKAANPNRKLSVYFEIMQITLSRLEIKSIREDIEKCKTLVQEGGDWEMKNKLKVYEGLYMILIRNYKEASDLLTSSIATFTCEDLIDFKMFVFYCVLSSLVSQDRKTLKQQINNPEIQSVVRELPHLKPYMDSYYKCNYKQFMESFCEIGDMLKKDHYFGFKKNYINYIKHMRLQAYKQFLESYKSVTIKSMAENFGVSEEFIDKEMFYFISNGKLKCSINKVDGIIESKKGTKHLEEYNNLIRQGDHLLNRMQKLGRVLDI